MVPKRAGVQVSRGQDRSTNSEALRRPFGLTSPSIGRPQQHSERRTASGQSLCSPKDVKSKQKESRASEGCSFADTGEIIWHEPTQQNARSRPGTQRCVTADEQESCRTVFNDSPIPAKVMNDRTDVQEMVSKLPLSRWLNAKSFVVRF